MMKDLNDKTLRQQFIQHYLDGETSIEEELALARFYQHCHDTLSTEEDSVRQLVLATTLLSEDFTLSDEKTEAFDCIMANTQRKARHIVLWPWLAAACAAAILAIILAPPRSEEIRTSQPQMTQIPQHEEKAQPEMTITDTSEVMPQTLLATTPSPPAPPDTADTEEDQSDLISIDSVFGIGSRPDPQEEYTALTEKLIQECDEVFQMINNNLNN